MSAFYITPSRSAHRFGSVICIRNIHNSVGARVKIFQESCFFSFSAFLITCSTCMWHNIKSRQKPYIPRNKYFPTTFPFQFNLLKLYSWVSYVRVCVCVELKLQSPRQCALFFNFFSFFNVLCAYYRNLEFIVRSSFCAGNASSSPIASVTIQHSFCCCWFTCIFHWAITIS